MKKWLWAPCGYVYNEVEGDMDSEITAETKFEDILESWVCPVCGLAKDQFKKM